MVVWIIMDADKYLKAATQAEEISEEARVSGKCFLR